MKYRPTVRRHARCIETHPATGLRCQGDLMHGGLHWRHRLNGSTLEWGEGGPVKQDFGELVPWPPEATQEHPQ